MPNFSDKEKKNLIIAFIDNELNEIDSLEIKKYIETNTKAKKEYLKLKETKTFLYKAYEPFNNDFTKLKMKKLIENFKIEEKKTLIALIKKIFNNLKGNFSIPNFAAGGALAGLIVFMSISSVPTLNNVATMNEEFRFDRSEINKFENILNENSISVAQKINNIENVLKENDKLILQKEIKMRGINISKEKMQLDNIIISVKKNDGCIIIEINSNDVSTFNKFCRTDNNEWLFQK